LLMDSVALLCKPACMLGIGVDLLFSTLGFEWMVS
jgi:hypothetical protein